MRLINILKETLIEKYFDTYIFPSDMARSENTDLEEACCFIEEVEAVIYGAIESYDKEIAAIIKRCQNRSMMTNEGISDKDSETLQILKHLFDEANDIDVAQAISDAMHAIATKDKS